MRVACVRECERTRRGCSFLALIKDLREDCRPMNPEMASTSFASIFNDPNPCASDSRMPPPPPLEAVESRVLNAGFFALRCGIVDVVVAVVAVEPLPSKPSPSS